MSGRQLKRFTSGKVKRFTSGKAQICLLMAACLLGILSIIAPVDVLKKLFGVLALALCFFWGAVFVTWAKMLAGEFRGLARDISSSEWRQYQQDPFSEQLRSAPPHTEQNKGNSESDKCAASSAELKTPRTISAFAPSGIPAIDIQGRPLAGAAGRFAADQVMGDDPGRAFRYLMREPLENEDRQIRMLTSGQLFEAVRPLADVSLIMPGYGTLEPDPEVAYILIDERELKTGAWAGVLTSAGTANFLLLMDLLKAQKQLGTVVIVIEDDVPGHFNGTLREMADVVVSNGTSDLRWENDVYSPILTACIKRSEVKN